MHYSDYLREAPIRGFLVLGGCRSASKFTADHYGFYASFSGHALPRAVVPAQERDDIRTCHIVACFRHQFY